MGQFSYEDVETSNEQLVDMATFVAVVRREPALDRTVVVDHDEACKRICGTDFAAELRAFRVSRVLRGAEGVGAGAVVFAYREEGLRQERSCHISYYLRGISKSPIIRRRRFPHLPQTASGEDSAEDGIADDGVMLACGAALVPGEPGALNILALASPDAEPIVEALLARGAGGAASVVGAATAVVESVDVAPLPTIAEPAAAAAAAASAEPAAADAASAEPADGPRSAGERRWCSYGHRMTNEWLARNATFVAVVARETAADREEMQPYHPPECRAKCGSERKCLLRGFRILRVLRNAENVAAPVGATVLAWKEAGASDAMAAHVTYFTLGIDRCGTPRGVPNAYPGMAPYACDYDEPEPMLLLARPTKLKPIDGSLDLLMLATCEAAAVLGVHAGAGGDAAAAAEQEAAAAPDEPAAANGGAARRGPLGKALGGVRAGVRKLFGK